jgi:hypothetical protein
VGIELNEALVLALLPDGQARPLPSGIARTVDVILLFKAAGD